MKNQEQQRPDWITPEQWEAVPYVSWWEANRRGEELNKQSKPVLPGEGVEQQREAYRKAGIKSDFLGV